MKMTDGLVMKTLVRLLLPLWVGIVPNCSRVDYNDGGAYYADIAQTIDAIVTNKDMVVIDMIASDDLGIMSCKIPGDSGLCPSGYFCAQDYKCRPCGEPGAPCCTNGVQMNVCASGLTCVGCSRTAWGLFTRCQTFPCGDIGETCCWDWKPFIDDKCGIGEPNEKCRSGKCETHKCVE